MRHLLPYVLLVFSNTCACSTGRGVRPLGAGKAAVGLSVGGPLVHNLGPALPLPITAAYLRLGATERTDVEAALYAPITRAVGVDVGASHLLALPKSLWLPAWMASLRLLSFVATPQFRLSRPPQPRAFVEAAVRASWQVGQQRYVFVGMDVLAQRTLPRLSPQLSVGLQGRLRGNWSVGAELRWLAFTRRSDALVVNYAGIGAHGALGLQLGVSYSFSLAQKRLGAAAATRRVP